MKAATYEQLVRNHLWRVTQKMDRYDTIEEFNVDSKAEYSV